MPGKYSHSVVLADYSSRGIIVLPPDQRDEYLKSLPLSRQQSNSALRSRGTRSAQANYADPSISSRAWQATTATHPHPSLGFSTSPQRPHTQTSIEENAVGSQSKRYSRCYDQFPYSSPAVNRVSQPERKTAYERQQQRIGPLDQTTEQEFEDLRGFGEASKRGSTLAPLGLAPVFRYRKSTNSVRTEVYNSKQHFLSPTPVANSAVSNSFISPGKPVGTPVLATRVDTDTNAQSLRTKTSKSTINDPSGERHEENRVYTTSRTLEHILNPKLVAPVSKQQRVYHSAPKQSQVNHLLREKESLNSVAPMPSSARRKHEPNFDGFSDKGEAQTSRPQFLSQEDNHSRNSSLNSVLLIQRPDSQNIPTARDEQATPTPLLSLRAASTRNDHNTPSRTTTSSMKGSDIRIRSNSSISSLSAPNGTIVTSSYMNQALSGKESQTQSGESPWHLSEIQEDVGFSPSIFEDTEGSHDLLMLDTFEIKGSMGMISSGRDVNYDDDAASDLSAALPPPITRFRDEEDEFNSNMAKILGHQGELPTSRNGTQTLGRSSMKKGRGFFAKLRSKNQTPNR